jgi:intracellular multiplication protein IcmE
MAKFRFGRKNTAGDTGNPSGALGAKSRAIIFFIILVVIVGSLIGYVLYRKYSATVATEARLPGTPGIESVPGVGKTSTEYVKLQEQQNIQQAKIAEQQGTSAVPTITRVSYFGPSEFPGGGGGAGRPDCNPEELRKARAAGVSAVELRCRGCSLAALKAAGYTAGELAAAGYSPTDLRNAGFTASELRQAGFTPAELKQAGFNASQLAQAGFSPASLSQAGFSNNDLQNAGISPADLAAAGIGVPTPKNLPQNCNISSLRQARAQGISAAALKKLNCGAAALRAAGYTAAELRAAGFTPEELRAAGFSPTELRAAGFTAGQLKRAGFTAQDLKNAGFSAGELRNAGFSAAALKNAGFTPNELKSAGFTSGDLIRAGVNPMEAYPGVAQGAAAGGVAGAGGPVNCSVEALRQAKAQGISAADLRARGCGAQAMLAAGFTPSELKAAGFTDDDLRAAGLTPAQIAAASAAASNQCSPEVLRQARAAGVSAAEIKRRGCSAQAMLAAGFTPQELKAAGFTDSDIAAAGITPGIFPSGVSGVGPGAGAAGVLGGGAAAPGGIAGAGAGAAGAGGGNASIPSVGNTELQLAQLQANQEQQLNAQQRQQRLAQVESSMVSQANSLFNTWTPPATQQYVAGEPPKEAAVPVTGTGAATAAAAATAEPVLKGVPVPPAGVGEAEIPCAYVKGGDIMMAVLDSTVNSDENSPVMATIVSGKLRGAKLIGQFTLLKKKVLINFNKMNMPGKPASIGINAVAIDPCSAQTALADCVNNHYWLRYGTLFASSFLSGLADAISQQGSQTSTGAGGILVTHDPLSTGQTIAVALGAVGSQYASVLGSNFTRPPSVYVYQGDSIGVLFMQDLTDVPRQCCPPDDRTCNAVGTGAGGGCSCGY